MSLQAGLLLIDEMIEEMIGMKETTVVVTETEIIEAEIEETEEMTEETIGAGTIEEMTVETIEGMTEETIEADNRETILRTERTESQGIGQKGQLYSRPRRLQRTLVKSMRISSLRKS